jgi:hypothetical protein
VADRGKAVYLIANADHTRNAFLQSLGQSGLRLPVAPLDAVTVTQNVNINSNVLPTAGSVVFGGGPGLATVSFDSFLPLEPNEPYAHLSTSQYGYRSPAEFDAQLRDIASNNVVFDLVISDSEGVSSAAYSYIEPDARVIFHKLAMIDSYMVTDEEGGALWYSISFTEYRPLFAKKVSATQKDIGPEFYVVTKLKTLEQIARRYTAFNVTVKQLIALNRKPGLPLAGGGKKDKVTNGKQTIKAGTKVRLRKKYNDPSQASIDNTLL